MENIEKEKLEKLLGRTCLNAACLEWQGSKMKGGYGNTAFLGKQWYVHRLVYTLARGAIPAGLVVMHSCDNRACINPMHLSVGTQGENLRDCVEKGRNFFTQKTHCPQGHAYTPENTRLKKRAGTWSRACLICQRAYFTQKAKCKALAKAAEPIVSRPLATHCINGHAFTAENTRTVLRKTVGGLSVKEIRNCRTCILKSHSAWYHRNREAVLVNSKSKRDAAAKMNSDR